MNYQLEICANSINSAYAADKAGATRIELCTNISEGGTTPSFGQISWCLENLTLEVWPLIRPRGGNFCYNEIEFQTILKEIQVCKELGCHGIVTGVLNDDFSLDISRCKKIIDTAFPMPVAFHRAFDVCTNPSFVLEELIGLGFVRILTSGRKSNAFDGRFQIKEWILQADGRIDIMPGAGINKNNIKEIAQLTNAHSFHTTAKKIIIDKTNNLSDDIVANIDDNKYYESDSEEIIAIKNVLEAI